MNVTPLRRRRQPTVRRRLSSGDGPGWRPDVCVRQFPRHTRLPRHTGFRRRTGVAYRPGPPTRPPDRSTEVRPERRVDGPVPTGHALEGAIRREPPGAPTASGPALLAEGSVRVRSSRVFGTQDAVVALAARTRPVRSDDANCAVGLDPDDVTRSAVHADRRRPPGVPLVCHELVGMTGAGCRRPGPGTWFVPSPRTPTKRSPNTLDRRRQRLGCTPPDSWRGSVRMPSDGPVAGRNRLRAPGDGASYGPDSEPPDAGRTVNGSVKNARSEY